MKTFESEYQELIRWRIARLKKSDKLPDDLSGLDSGERSQQEMKDGEEYRKRLRALKKKYNR